MKLFSWGANSYGQLSQGKISNECLCPEEVDISDLNINLQDIISITGGGGHSFLIHNSGQVFGCGLNNAGQLCCASQCNVTKFQEIDNLKGHNIIQISAKWDTSFALTKTENVLDGEPTHLDSWGFNQMVSSRTPVTLIPYMVQQVEAGLRHCAIVTPEGYVLTSGDNRKGQLGRPLTESEPAHSFQPVPEMVNVRMVACGQHHTLALTADDKLFGWGCNKFGQLGFDPTLHQSIPNPVEIPVPKHSINAQTVIASGWTHSAILTGDGMVINWGRNKYGQLGCSLEERQSDWKPQILEGTGKVIQLELGSEHTLALLDDGILMSWGWNEHGSCGIGNSTDITKPECVNLNNTKAMLAGTGAGHSFAIVY